MATQMPFVASRRQSNGTLTYRGWAMVSGKRVWSQSYATEHDAYLAAMRMRGAAADGVAGKSLDDACEELLDELRAKRTKGSVRWYSDHLRAVRRLIPGETHLHAITAETIEQFVLDRLRPGEGARKVKPATVNADLRALHRVFAVAIRKGHVRDNPVRKVDRPRADAPAMDWFTDAELRDLLGKITDQRMRDVLLLFALTGVRRSEASRLEPVHVRMTLRQMVVPGKNATRVVPLSPDLDAPLVRLLAVASTLLVGTTHAIDDLFREAKEAVGDRRMHPHALRHTFGTALIRSGVRPDVVMRLMGHRSITTTLRYVHEVGEDGAKAVGLLRLVPPAGSGQSAPG